MVRRAREQREKNFFFYFGITMGVLYIITGVLLIVRGDSVPQLVVYLPGNSRLFIGIILIGYGAFRIARIQYRRRAISSINDNEQILDSDEHP